MKVDPISLAGAIVLVLMGVPLIRFLASLVEDKGHPSTGVPVAIRRAAFLEFSFGYLIILLSVGIYIIHAAARPNPVGYLLAGLAGVAWVWMAVLLRRGNAGARKACLILSFVRIPTGFGVLFSALAIYLLYVVKESKEFFDRP